MERKLKDYLEWANFNIKNPSPQYKLPLLCDFSVALLYTAISIVLICMQKASVIVYGLNILCLVRALISNIISASKVTNSIVGAEIDKKHEGNSHYHIEVYILGSVFFMAMLLLLALLKEQSGLIIKLFTSLVIVVVFVNDCEDMVVCAFDAEINRAKTDG